MGVFLEDDPIVAALGADLAWPLALDGNGDLAEVSGFENLLSALPLRAITPRGSVPHRPLDGFNNEEFQNGPMAEEENAVIQARMLEQYGEREDRLTAISIEIAETVEGDTRAFIRANSIVGQAVDVTAEVPR